MFAKCFARFILQYVPEGSGSWKYNHYFPVAEGEGKITIILPDWVVEFHWEESATNVLVSITQFLGSWQVLKKLVQCYGAIKYIFETERILQLYGTFTLGKLMEDRLLCYVQNNFRHLRLLNKFKYT